MIAVNTLIIWIIVGAIAGVLVDNLLGGMRFGLAGAMMIGILGAILGGWVFEQTNVQILSGMWGSVLESFLGSLVLLLIFSVIRRT